MASASLLASAGKTGSNVSYGALEASQPTPKTDPAYGLSSDEARRLLEEHGPNELETAEKEPFWKVFLAQTCNVIFLLTTVASIFCYATGDRVKGTFLAVLVIVVCLINAWGEYSGQDAGAALKALDGATTAAVWRDGVLNTNVPVVEIVPGDVVEVSAGKVVPADIELVECNNLQVNESLLTGEPLEVFKFADKSKAKPKDALPCNCIFKTTDIKKGKGKGIVWATGMGTKVGLIAKRLKNPDNEDPKAKIQNKLNPLQISINTLGTIIAACCGIVIVIGTAASFFLGYQNVPATCAQTDRTCLAKEAILRGLIMAIGIIPHGLPLVVMVMLQVGSKLMFGRHAMVMKRSAVDYLGATQVICTDKTGTLTAGKMAVKSFVSIIRSQPSAGASPGLWRTASKPAPLAEYNVSFYPLDGLNPSGGIYPSQQLLDKHKNLLDQGIAPDSLVGVTNLANPNAKAPGDLTPMALVTQVGLAASFVHCHDCKIMPPSPDSKEWRAPEASTTDAALKAAAWRGGLVEDREAGNNLKGFLRMDDEEKALEVIFNSDRKMAATVHRLPEDRCLDKNLQFKREHTHVAILKGAPDRIVPSLGAFLTVQGDHLVLAEGAPTKEELDQITKMNLSLSNQALRAILMAVRPLTAKDVSALQKCADDEKRLQRLLAPGPLAFLGLWGIYDPPRKSVPPSVRIAREAFIRVVMITGDQLPTAVAIGKKVGILDDLPDQKVHARVCTDLHHDDPKIVREESAKALATRKASKKPLHRALSIHDPKTEKDSHEQEYVDTDTLVEMTGEVNVWSRAEPTDKVCVVDSLNTQGLVVAMTGDGVNDAPAMKRADIGVAMGITGTDVTKQTADIVLMDDNFSTIIAAVAEGRKIYGNVQKYVIYNLCVKGSECLCCLIAIFANLPLPISGLPQLVNLVATHIIPPIALAWEDAESYTMRLPPRKTKGDLVIDRVYMLYRWVPYLLCYAFVICSSMNIYMWMQTGYVTVTSIAGSAEANAVAEGKAACQVAGQLSPSGDFVADKLPFHCTCFNRRNPWDSQLAVVDQWGIADTSSVTMDRWTGSTGDAYLYENTPWKNGQQTFVEKCRDRNGQQHLCWKDPLVTKPLLSPTNNCAAFGARKAEAMSYVSIQTGEVLSLATFRTDGFVGFAPFSAHYTSMLAFNLLVLLTVLHVPWVNSLLGFQPLEMHYFLLALAAPMVLVMLSEFIKIPFCQMLRRKHVELIAQEEGSAKFVDDGQV